MNDASPEPQIMFAGRPRQCVRELHLMAPEIRESRLANREGHCAAASVSSREVLSFPTRHRIAVKICEARLVQELCAEDRRVIELHGP